MKSWTILDIEPTDDISSIKKAYAKKLKIHHPESDPEGYQALREAYDAAVKYAKSYKTSANRADVTENLELMPKISIETEPLYPLPIELPEIKPEPSPSIYEQNSDFIFQVEALYNDFNSRINIDNWENLLNSDLLWNLENKLILSRILLDFLSSHHHLPKETWMLLEDTFKWCDQAGNMGYHNKSEFITYIQKQLSNPWPLDYSFLQIIDGVNYEAFLEHREKVQDSIITENITAAKHHLEKAKIIYADDPDLLHLEGIIYLLSEDLDSALVAFKKALSINPEDPTALRYLITTYWENNQTEEALETYKNTYSEAADTNILQLFVARSYFKLGALDKAKTWALKAVETFPPQNEANILLSQIYANLRKKLSKALAEEPSNHTLKLRLDEVDAEVFRRTATNNQLENTKVDSKSATEAIKSIFKIVLALLLLLISIGLIFVSKFGIIIIIILAVKKLVFKKGK